MDGWIYLLLYVVVKQEREFKVMVERRMDAASFIERLCVICTDWILYLSFFFEFVITRSKEEKNHGVVHEKRAEIKDS